MPCVEGKQTPGAPSPDFLWTLVKPMNCTRLSVKKAAHSVVGRGLVQEIRVPRLLGRDVGFRITHPLTTGAQTAAFRQNISPGLRCPPPGKANPGCPIPDFLWTLVKPMNWTRLSVKKAAHSVVGRGLVQEIRVSRRTLARCGIPRHPPPNSMHSNYRGPR